jgi:hypothetical protein
MGNIDSKVQSLNRFRKRLELLQTENCFLNRLLNGLVNNFLITNTYQNGYFIPMTIFNPPAVTTIEGAFATRK